MYFDQNYYHYNNNNNNNSSNILAPEKISKSTNIDLKSHNNESVMFLRDDF